MQLNLIELDIKDREEALRRCKVNLQYLRTSSEGKKHPEEIKLTEYEMFYLKDQLQRFYILAGILKKEQGACDEMLPKV
jgi:hypothetical protein